MIEFLTMKMKIKGPGWEEVTGGIAEKGGGVPTPIPAPEIVPSPMPAPVSPERAIDSVALGFDVFAHPGLWFLFGALFVILVVFLIGYYGRKKDRED